MKINVGWHSCTCTWTGPSVCACTRICAHAHVFCYCNLLTYDKDLRVIRTSERSWKVFVPTELSQQSPRPSGRGQCRPRRGLRSLDKRQSGRTVLRAAGRDFASAQEAFQGHGFAVRTVEPVSITISLSSDPTTAPGEGPYPSSEPLPEASSAVPSSGQREGPEGGIC